MDKDLDQLFYSRGALQHSVPFEQFFVWRQLLVPDYLTTRYLNLPDPVLTAVT